MMERLPHKERANLTFDRKNTDPFKASFWFTLVLLGPTSLSLQPGPRPCTKALQKGWHSTLLRYVDILSLYG